MTAAALPRQSIRFHSRSIHAMVLAPEPPLADWLAELDSWLERSPQFFLGRPVVLDAAALETAQTDIEELLKNLYERKIRVLGIEGLEPAADALTLPPALTFPSRPAPMAQVAEAAEVPETSEQAAAPAPTPPNSLLVDSPVRSGQSIENFSGDVIVIGSVASGAEIIAGGSIHVYGALRGRAIAGSRNPRARIFCSKLEAELLAIDGLYVTADAMRPELRGRPVQAWLEGDSMMMTAQDKSPTGR